MPPISAYPLTSVSGHTTIVAYPPRYLGGYATIWNSVSVFIITNYRIGEEKDEKWICNDEGSLMSPLVSDFDSSSESKLSAVDSKSSTTQWGLHHCKSKIVPPKILKNIWSNRILSIKDWDSRYILEFCCRRRFSIHEDVALKGWWMGWKRQMKARFQVAFTAYTSVLLLSSTIFMNPFFIL